MISKIAFGARRAICWRAAVACTSYARKTSPVVVRAIVGSRSFSFAAEPNARAASTMLSEGEQQLKESVAVFVKEVVAPKVAEMDEKGEMDPEIIKACFDQGIMGICAPEEYGGVGLGFTSVCVAVEEIATVDPALAVLVDIHNTINIPSLMYHGTPEQKAKWLPLLATSTPSSFCLTEAGSGSDAFALKTRAEWDAGAKQWVINGTKSWISNSSEAGLFIVFANVDPSKGHRGITAFLVERGTPGLTVGQREKKLGIRASSTCEVSFDNVRVGSGDVLGKVGEGYKIAISLLNEGRIGIGAQMIGLSRGAFQVALDYIHERKQFGKTIADFQGMQFQYARAAMEIEAAKVLVYNAARLRENGLPFTAEAAMAKLLATETAQRVASQAVDWMGGVGYTKATPAERFYRDSKIGTIYEGTSNMQLSTIAKLLQAPYKK
mmetsp:Transcript_86535/g.231159  ORF Transcript_86535/g.231159 Transcript_86535/m.231159 type:complete len:437 (+) Transcript_86535:1-1311(+)